MPFGGRQREIEQLNEWLRDPAAPRSMLLWGPAGRGKSALIVNWLAQLSHDVPRAFVPISIRADTNTPAVFYQALTARLATILRKPVPAPQFDPVSFYRERVKELLAEFTDPERPCLVVIDGLDEAAGWQVDRSVLPATPPPGLKIVVSARQLAGDRDDADWLRRLGWDARFARALSREVRPLDRMGVTDVLERMGNPLAHLAGQERIVDELYRLTNHGDPLLLSLYVEDLASKENATARLSPEDLRGLKPGFAAYFENWYDDQRKAWLETGERVDEAFIETVFAILACAIGPLMLVDIEEILVRVTAEPSSPVTLSTLRPLQRFVIGHSVSAVSRGQWQDSPPAQGFVLSHPRLAEFFREQKFAGTGLITSIQSAFCTWGRDAACGKLRHGGETVPRYLLHYYLQHLLSDPGAPLECYRELAEDRWQRAWKAEEGGYGSFSDQMEVCWQNLFAAHRRDPSLGSEPRIGLGGLVHIGFCLSSVRGIGSNAPAGVIIALVEAGLLDTGEAMMIARNRQIESDRQRIALALAEKVQSGSDSERQLLQLARKFPAPAQVQVLLSAAERAEAEEASALFGEALRVAADDTNLQQYVRSAFAAHASATGNILSHSAWQEVAREAAPPAEIAVAYDSSAGAARTSKPSTAVVPRDTEEPPANAAPTEAAAGSALVEFIEGNDSDLAGLVQALGQDLSDSMLARFLETLVQRVPPYRVGEIGPQLRRTPLPLRRRLLLQCLTRFDEKFETAYRCQHIAIELLRDLPEETFAEVEGALIESACGHHGRKLLEQFAARFSVPAIDSAIRAAFAPGASYYEEVRAAALFDHAAVGLQQQLLNLALGSRSEDARPNLLGEIAPKLSAEQMGTVVGAAACARIGERARLLAVLVQPAASKAPDQIETIIEASRRLNSVADRVMLADELLPVLDEDRRREVLAELRGVSLDVGDKPMIALALAALGESPDLSGVDVSEWSVFRSEGELNSVATWCLALVALLPHVPQSAAETAMAMARRRAESFSADERLWLYLLIALCPKLTPIAADAAVRDALGFMNEPLLSEPGDKAVYAAMLLFSPHLDEATVSDLTNRTLAALRDDGAKMLDQRALVASFLLVCPRVNWAVAAEALAHIRLELQKEQVDPEPYGAMLIALALSNMADSGEFESFSSRAPGAIRAADADPSDLNVRDFLDYGLLGLREVAPDTEVVGAFLRRLAQLDRASALILLAVVEGRWTETFGLRPRSGGGQPSFGVLRRWGGEHAVRETILAIKCVSQWWP